MLKVANNLAGYSLAAGEAFILSVQLRSEQNAVLDHITRKLVLSFYDGARNPVEQIQGLLASGPAGAFFYFVRDGRLSESLFGKSLQVELAEQLLEGREILATGPLTIDRSSGGVASYGSLIGRTEVRAMLYFDDIGTVRSMEISRVRYSGPATPAAPKVVTPAAIGSDGTPQIGESFTPVPPTGTNFKSVTLAWLRGTTVLNTPGTDPYVGDFQGDLTLEATITGDDGSILKSRATITVAPPPSAKITITGTPPLTGKVGQPYSYAPTVANGSGTRVFALQGGPLLPGLTQSPTTGAITGTPTASGIMEDLSVIVADDTGNAATPATDVTIEPAASGIVTADSVTITADSVVVTADGGSSGTAPTPAPTVTVTGPASIVEGTDSASSPAVSITGPASIVEGNPSSIIAAVTGPATITEGN